MQILKENAHLIDLEWTEDEHPKLKALVEGHTSTGVSEAWRLHRWRLGCFLLVLGDKEERNDISGQWHDQWPLATSVESSIFR